MSTRYTDEQYSKALVKKFFDGGFDQVVYNVDDEPKVANSDEAGAYVEIWYWMSDDEMAELGFDPVNKPVRQEEGYLLVTDAEPGITYCQSREKLLGEIETFVDACIENGGTPEEALVGMEVAKLKCNHAVLEPASEHVSVAYDESNPAEWNFITEEESDDRS